VVPGNWNSGRRPQPTAVRLLRGNPGKRRLPVDEPQPPPVESSFDTPPPELDGDAAACAEWTRLAPMLRISGMITVAERGALIALAQQWSRYQDAQRKILSLGMVVKGQGGSPIVNPYLRVADAALQHCQRLWVELGLTPSTRSRMATLPGSDADERRSRWAGLI
jgi:P27 family predicted phage terminase small subunit